VLDPTAPVLSMVVPELDDPTAVADPYVLLRGEIPGAVEEFRGTVPVYESEND
jgi:hypothetical protein